MNKDFWKAALIRALRTVCQAAIAMIPAAATIQSVDWLTVLSTAALAGVVSLLTSVATGLPEVDVATDKGQKDLDPYEHEHPPDGHVTVLADEDYDKDGSPVKEGDGDADC